MRSFCNRGDGHEQPHPHDDETGPIPWVQQLLDNPFLLLFSVFVPMVVYTVWGVYDILTLPIAK